MGSDEAKVSAAGGTTITCGSGGVCSCFYIIPMIVFLVVGSILYGNGECRQPYPFGAQCTILRYGINQNNWTLYDLDVTIQVTKIDDSCLYQSGNVLKIVPVSNTSRDVIDLTMLEYHINNGSVVRCNCIHKATDQGYEDTVTISKQLPLPKEEQDKIITTCDIGFGLSIVGYIMLAIFLFVVVICLVICFLVIFCGLSIACCGIGASGALAFSERRRF